MIGVLGNRKVQHISPVFFIAAFLMIAFYENHALTRFYLHRPKLPSFA